MIQGRPLSLHDEWVDSRIPTLQELEIDQSTSLNSLDNYQLSTSYLILPLHRFRIDKHISHIIQLFYHLPARSHSHSNCWRGDPQKIKAIQSGIEKNLSDWFNEVPELCLSTGNAWQSQVFASKLESIYYTALTLLFQPSPVIQKPSDHAISICYKSSSKRLQAYKRLSDMGALNHNWRLAQAIYSSSVNLIYSFWISSTVRSSVPWSDTLRDIRTSSSLLSVNGEWWKSIKRGKESLERMIDLTIQRFGGHDEPEHSRAVRRRRNQPGNRSEELPVLYGQPVLPSQIESHNPRGIENSEAFEAHGSTNAHPNSPINPFFTLSSQAFYETELGYLTATAFKRESENGLEHQLEDGQNGLEQELDEFLQDPLNVNWSLFADS